jgi:DNA-directed RNA polymerase specialized sigma24 family protein
VDRAAESDIHVREVQALFIRHQPAVRAMAIALAGDFGLAEDVVQETFITVTEKAATFTLGTNFSAWVAAIARNKVLQKRGALPRLSTDVIESLAASMPHDDEDHRLQAWLDRRIDAEELAELEGLLLESAAVRAEFWERGMLHGLLYEASKTEFGALETSPLPPPPSSARAVMPRWFSLVTSLALLLAGCLLGGISGGAAHRTAGGPGAAPREFRGRCPSRSVSAQDVGRMGGRRDGGRRPAPRCRAS